MEVEKPCVWLVSVYLIQYEKVSGEAAEGRPGMQAETPKHHVLRALRIAGVESRALSESTA